MQKLILVKLGGSLITDKKTPFCAREDVIKRLAEEIKGVEKEFDGRIILGHGSGSFGHTVASKYRTQEGIINKQSVKGLSIVADAAIQINRILIRNFLEFDLPVFSLAPASFIFARDQKLEKIFLRPILHSLQTGLIPVIYGDVILDSERGCCIFSCEKTLNILAGKLRTNFRDLIIIQAGITDGVYDKRKHTIPEITPSSFRKFKESICKSEAIDVTGGMLYKVEEALKVAHKFDIKTLIINGTIKGELERAILKGKTEGTIITNS